MKKTFITFVLVSLVCSIQAQKVYVYSGKNFTTYDYKNSSGNSNPNLKRGTGAFYEVGYNKNLNYNRFSYSLAIALEEYNNKGGNAVNSYEWDTQYLGIQTRLYYSYLKGKDFDFLSTVGLDASSIVSGNQQINGILYDLTKEKEFEGLLLSPSIGLQFKYNVTHLGHVSLGYNYIKSYNLSNTTNQKLGFSTNQIQFGMHFEIKSKKPTQPVISKTKLIEDSSSLNSPKEETIVTGKVSDVVILDENYSNNTNAKEEVKEELIPFNTNEVPIIEGKSIFNFSAKALSILEVDNDLIHKTIAYLLKNPNKKLVLNGYSSSDGLDKENYKLSLKRAYVAKEYFILNGIPENRIETNGMGAANPKYPNTTVEGRLKNKRVEIEFK